MDTKEVAGSTISEGDLHRHSQQRSRILLNHITALPRPDSDIHRKLMWYSIARLGSGVRTEQALADIEFVNDDPASEDMFFRHANIDAYLRFGHLYSEKLRQTVRQRMTQSFEIHHGHTENHRIMLAVAGYLTAQTWPDWNESKKTLAAMADWLSTFFDRVSRFGQGEFDSTTYSLLYPLTLATLFDFSVDDLMRQKARMMLDWFLANAASEWLNGYFIGGHSRDVHPTEGPEFATAGGTAMWLFFGGRQPDLKTGEPHYAGMLALTSYRMPSILARISLDRRQPYEHRETHELMPLDGETHDLVMTKQVDSNSKGYGYVSQVGVRKYTWRTANYAVGSLYDGKSGEVNFWAAVRRWAIDWDSEQPGSTLFFTHPFPPPQAANDDWYRTWQGSSPFEQVLQHRDALIALYNVPSDGSYYHPFSKTSQPSNQNPFIEGFFSGTAFSRLIEEPSGWIFAHGGSVLIAIRPLRHYHWIDTPGSSAQPYKHGRLRSDGAKNAVVIETADPSEFFQEHDFRLSQREVHELQLNRFSEAILSKSKIETSSLDGPVLFANYTTRTGDHLHITFDGERSINGKAVDYLAWPLIDNPFMHSAVNSAKLELRYGGESLNLDFASWSTSSRAHT